MNGPVFSPGDVVHLRDDYNEYCHSKNPTNIELSNYDNLEYLGLIPDIPGRQLTITKQDPWIMHDGDNPSSYAYRVKESYYYYRGCWFQEFLDADNDENFAIPAETLNSLYDLLEV